MSNNPENRRTLASKLFPVLPPIGLVAGSLLLFAYLLKRFPYDGFYAPDNYAYYYQARALWEQITGTAPRTFELFTADGLQHWPVGYHIQIIAGFLLSGVSPAGGWLATILMAALCPAILYFIVHRLFISLGLSGYVTFLLIAGLVAGALLPLDATFTRTGLSLMSDIPTLFWALLSIYFFVRASPMHRPEDLASAISTRQRNLFFAFAGFSLGISVLIRYGAALLLGPVIIYLVLAALKDKPNVNTFRYLLARVSPALWGVPFFLLALAPQVLYLITHNPGTGVSDFLGGVSTSNIFATTTYSTDGTSTFEHPMIAFYLLGPIWQVQPGFYSPFLIPALLLGMFFLVWRRQWRILVFLLAWWIFPALIYSMTPYQAHRFALIYLPAIAILIGCGIGYAVCLLLNHVPRLAARLRTVQITVPISDKRITIGLSFAILLLFGIGIWQGWNSVRDWMATHSAWEQANRNSVALLQETAQQQGLSNGEPRTITLGLSAPIYHYTQWPVLELYFADPKTLAQFLAGAELHMAIVPENSLATKWANTPTADNWQWLLSHYTLERKLQDGDNTIFIIHSKSGTTLP